MEEEKNHLSQENGDISKMELMLISGIEEIILCLAFIALDFVKFLH